MQGVELHWRPHSHLSWEERRPRLVVRWQLAFAVLLALSTLAAWENHPRFVADPHGVPGYYIIETSHTIGVLTRPAGTLVAGLALIALLWAPWLASRRIRMRALLVCQSVAAFLVTTAEFFQLLFGRRNWEARMPPVLNPALANAVGTGVWLALAASVGLFGVALAYERPLPERTVPEFPTPRPAASPLFESPPHIAPPGP